MAESERVSPKVLCVTEVLTTSGIVSAYPHQ